VAEASKKQAVAAALAKAYEVKKVALAEAEASKNEAIEASVAKAEEAKKVALAEAEASKKQAVAAVLAKAYEAKKAALAVAEASKKQAVAAALAKAYEVKKVALAEAEASKNEAIEASVAKAEEAKKVALAEAEASKKQAVAAALTKADISSQSKLAEAEANMLAVVLIEKADEDSKLAISEAPVDMTKAGEENKRALEVTKEGEKQRVPSIVAEVEVDASQEAIVVAQASAVEFAAARPMGGMSLALALRELSGAIEVEADQCSPLSSFQRAGGANVRVSNAEPLDEPHMPVAMASSVLVSAQLAASSTEVFESCEQKLATIASGMPMPAALFSFPANDGCAMSMVQSPLQKPHAPTSLQPALESERATVTVRQRSSNRQRNAIDRFVPGDPMRRRAAEQMVARKEVTPDQQNQPHSSCMGIEGLAFSTAPHHTSVRLLKLTCGYLERFSLIWITVFTTNSSF
jgi:hypothetical protein